LIKRRHRAVIRFTGMVHWDGRDDNGQQVSSGVYLYRIDAGEYISTRKMVMVR
jgi:hypothetical protein